MSRLAEPWPLAPIDWMAAPVAEAKSMTVWGMTIVSSDEYQHFIVKPVKEEVLSAGLEASGTAPPQAASMEAENPPRLLVSMSCRSTAGMIRPMRLTRVGLALAQLSPATAP